MTNPIDVWLSASPHRHLRGVFRGRGHTTLELVDEVGIVYRGAGRSFDEALSAALARFEADQNAARAEVERDDAVFEAEDRLRKKSDRFNEQLAKEAS